MSKLIFTFQRDWLDEKKKQFGNPIRKMERMLRDYEQGTLLKSDFDSFTAEVDEDKREQLVAQVWHFVSVNFNEPDPGAYITLGGDSRDLEPPAADALPTDVTPTPPPPAPEEPAEPVPAPEVEVVHRKPEKKPGDKAPDFPRPVEEMQQPPAPVEEDLLDSLCRKVPMCFSSELADYLRELGQVIPMLDRMNANDCIWAQNLIVAMDSGFGFTAFINALQSVYNAFGVTQWNREVKEITVEKGTKSDNNYEGWAKAVDAARILSDSGKRAGHGGIILALDVRKWQSELGTPEVREYLRQINKYASRLVCVFRVSFMEGQVVRRISAVIDDLMPVRTLTVPPISLAHMIAYFKEQIDALNCTVEDGCDEAVEQWIVQERSDGSFFGYRSLEKMARQIVLFKALVNCRQDTASRSITAQDIAAYRGNIVQEADPYEQLAQLVGMEHIKQRIREVVVQIKTQKELAAEGSGLERPAIHMMFTGNPGTGKTTVARLLAGIMKQEGLLSKGLLFEIKGRDLCGRYVGETAPRTSTYCRDAYGSVLFIDEAYALYQRDMGRDFGKEAIATLVAEMENHRDDFCVIMAGYKAEMEEMLEANSGLESRIPYIIDFPNYTREELEEIFFRMLGERLKYSDDLRDTMRELFGSIPQKVMEEKTFSNARMVRNLFERIWGKAAYRRSLLGEKDIVILKEDAMSAFEEHEFQKLLEDTGSKRRIGFFVDGG